LRPIAVALHCYNGGFFKKNIHKKIPTRLRPRESSVPLLQLQGLRDHEQGAEAADPRAPKRGALKFCQH